MIPKLRMRDVDYGKQWKTLRKLNHGARKVSCALTAWLACSDHGADFFDNTSDHGADFFDNMPALVTAPGNEEDDEDWTDTEEDWTDAGGEAATMHIG